MYQRKDKRGVAPLGQPQQVVQTAQTPQHAVIQEDPSALDMAKQMAVGKVAGAGLEKGMEMAAPLADKAMTGIQSGIHSALTPALGAEATATGAMAAHPLMGAAGTGGATAAGALGGGAMGAMSAAMPWLGAGLLGGKLLGFFSKGGLVGPLAGIKYKSNGGEVSDEYQVKFVSPLSAKE